MSAWIVRRVRDRWTRGAVLACFAFIVVALPIAAHAEEATKHFDIKAQPLSEALMAFGAQTGAIVMASSELTTGKTSKPVTGQLTVQEALTRMLLGTGLRFETSANGAILIVRATPPSR
jgi:iron complex outermembrane receptor protein